MGCDYYIETHMNIIFKDAARKSENLLLSVLDGYRDDLFDTQILSKEIIYKDNNWVYDSQYLKNIDINQVKTIEKVVSVRERF